VILDRKELLARQVRLVQLALKACGETQVFKAKLDQLAPKVFRVFKESRAKLDTLVQLVQQEPQGLPETQAQLVRQG
jgi:hypothetical protein